MSRQFKLREAALGCSFVLSLALCAPSALAFTQEPVQAPDTNAQSKAPAQGQQGGAQMTPGQLADPFSQPSKSNGTELLIPGIGSVGTIPKVDFGLELLYGQRDQTQNNIPGLQLDSRSQEILEKKDDVQIKGTLKHKF